MRTWNSTIAKQHFSQIIDASGKEPQIVERRGKPVSAVISYDEFKKVEAVLHQKSIKTWLSELQEIDEDDLDGVGRTDRDQPDWEL